MTARIVALASEYGRYGYRRITALGNSFMGTSHKLTGLPAGNYFVTSRWDGAPDINADTFPIAWDNKPCGEPCDPTFGDLIAVDGANDVGGIDFNLQSNGGGSFAQLSGRVVDAVDGVTPVFPVAVDLLDPATGESVAGTSTAPDGTYVLPPVPAGEYKLFFNAVGEAEFYVDELFDEYCRLFYGPVESEMKAFFEYCEAHWQEMEREKSTIDAALELFAAAEADPFNANATYGLASLAALFMVGNAIFNFFQAGADARTVIQAALFGVTALVAAVLANQVAYWARDYRLVAEKRKEALSELEQANELIIRRMRTGVIAVDENDRVRIMNESAWFSMGSPQDRHKHIRELSPRLSRALAKWKRHPHEEPKPLVLEASQSSILPSFVALPAESGLGAMIFLTDNNVVARRAVGCGQPAQQRDHESSAVARSASSTRSSTDWSSSRSSTRASRWASTAW